MATDRASTSRFDWGLAASGLIFVACIGAIALLQWPQLRSLKQGSQSQSTAELKRQLESEQTGLRLLQKVPTLGYDNLISDVVFLKFLQYFGDEPARQRTDYTLSPDFFDVIIGRNPLFLKSYIFLSTSTALYAGLPERSVALMDQGLRSLSPDMPGAYYVWRNKAIDELLFLGDSQAAQRSFEQAAQWASRWNTPEAQMVADLSRQTAQFLAKNPNSKFAQAAAWMMVLSNAPDQRTQKIAIERIQALGGEIVQNPGGAYQIIPPPQD